MPTPGCHFFLSSLLRDTIWYSFEVCIFTGSGGMGRNRCDKLHMTCEIYGKLTIKLAKTEEWVPISINSVN